MIRIYEPYFGGNENKYLLDCINSGWISSQGNYLSKFERALADYHSVRNAIATSSCTAALHLSIKSLNIGIGDEVICPDLTFIAPANMVLLSGASLKLVDIDEDTLTLDPDKIIKNISKKTKAIILVHQFGHSAHMDEVLSIAKKFKIKIIEDNAESLGGKYKGERLGTLGDISTFSFFANKIITTGEGGAVLTNNDKIAIKVRELRDHGMNYKKKYHHNDLGYNYRMTNMQAAVGLAQIEKIDKILEIRKNQMDIYNNILSTFKGIKLRKFKKWCSPVHWLMTITLDEKYNRESFLKFMLQNKIDCRQMINPVHEADHMKSIYSAKNFSNSLKISKKSVHLPSGTSLDKNSISYICDKVKEFLQK